MTKEHEELRGKAVEEQINKVVESTDELSEVPPAKGFLRWVEVAGNKLPHPFLDVCVDLCADHCDQRCRRLF
jgi:hypothetical protein